ncbi:hypothetical protein GGI03_001437 [Coemansia sp. RSA 2337]|nr:hypothetical protein H4S03_005110 [Coemansia sp. S3946]KAJ2467668.1 hypothetical protein GGI03_001437 [Coemansia sp. RSA 2337]
MTVKTFTVSIDEKVVVMSLDELKAFLDPKMIAEGIKFENGFDLFNEIAKTSFTNSPFAAQDYSTCLLKCGNMFRLVVKAKDTVKVGL